MTEMNLFMKQKKLTDIEKKMVAKGDRRWRRDKLGVGISRYKLLYIK